MLGTMVAAVVLCLTLALPAATPALADTATADATHDTATTGATTGIIVQAESRSAAKAALDALADTLPVADAEPLPSPGLAAVEVPQQAVEEAVALLSDEPGVDYVELDVRAQVAATPNDPLWYHQWGARRAGLPAAWDFTTGDPGVVIAVLDTGVDTQGADFAGASIAGGVDLVNRDLDPSDDHGHGTSVAGVIAAQHHDGTGIAGVCPRCTILPVKVLAANGSGYHSTIAAGIDWAVAAGADIINLSLGSAGSTTTLQEAVAGARAAGVLVLAAAGNAGTRTVHYPAAYRGAVAVAASTPADGRYSFSTYGGWVELAAPGCNPAPQLDGSTRLFCGTSSATPLVAGVAGLLASIDPGAQAARLTRVLARTAVSKPYVMQGRVDASAAALVSSAHVFGPAATRLSVRAARSRLRDDKRTWLRGRMTLAATGTPLAGRPVLLQRRSNDAWRIVARKRSAGDGRIAFPVRPRRPTAFRLTFLGDTTLAVSRSAGTRVLGGSRL